jgi:hypothetical protein
MLRVVNWRRAKRKEQRAKSKRANGTVAYSPNVIFTSKLVISAVSQQRSVLSS